MGGLEFSNLCEHVTLVMIMHCCFMGQRRCADKAYGFVFRAFHFLVQLRANHVCCLSYKLAPAGTLGCVRAKLLCNARVSASMLLPEVTCLLLPKKKSDVSCCIVQ